MSRLLTLIKLEPALLTNAVQAVIGIITAFGIGFTAGQTAGILAVTAALLAAFTAAAARPVTPAAFTGLVTAAGVLVAAYGIHLPADLVGSVNLLITAAFAMLTRANVTPVVTLRKQAAAQALTLVPVTSQVPQVDVAGLARKLAAELVGQVKMTAAAPAAVVTAPVPASHAGFTPATENPLQSM